tara:strand:- start:1181 stop:1600 length:420 start_codon:yes stop_codon:yes gene_type:complete
MTPLETIKTGILNDDMEKVIQGYMVLTGEEVRPKLPKDGVSERREPASVSVRQARAMDFSKEPIVSKEKTPVVAGSNQFVDDGAEHSDITTPDITPSPRKREEAKTVNVKCHVCGKDQEINPVLAQGKFYRCDSCVGKK